MHIIVVGPYARNSDNHNICPAQMCGFMDAIQILQAITSHRIRVSFYDPCFSEIDKSNLERIYRENNIDLTVYIQVFSDLMEETFSRNMSSTLLISFTGVFDKSRYVRKITYIECCCNYGRNEISRSWTEILPEFITQTNGNFHFCYPWPNFRNMTLFDLIDFYSYSKQKPWFEIVSFQIKQGLGHKRYLSFNNDTPQHLTQWCFRHPNYILTNNVPLSDFYQYLLDKNFDLNEKDKNILLNSWTFYRRDYNIDL